MGTVRARDSRCRTDPIPPVVQRCLHHFAAGLPGGARVRHMVTLAPGVWRLDREADAPVVAKQQLFGPLTRGSSHDLIMVETLVFASLAQAGCPVPAVLGADSRQQVIFLEHAGDLTLDEWIRTAGLEGRKTMGIRLAYACRSIEAVMAERTPAFRRHAAPGCDRNALAVAWNAAGRQAEMGLAWFFRKQPALIAPASAILQRIVTTCAGRPPVLGTMDYNARNVVISPERRPYFIEFATLGWDWPERRLAQYGLCLGSRDQEAGIISVLDPGSGLAYQRAGGNPKALEQHQVVLLLNAAARLIQALRAPQAGSNPALLQCWRHPRRRLAQLGELLATRWNLDPDATRLRHCLRHVVVPMTT